jgi:hypothetical protein
LCGVIDVLVVTASATREVGAAGFDAFGRRRKHALEFGARKSGAAFNHRRFHLFTRQNKWDENGFAASMFIGRQARKPVAAVNQFLNGKLQMTSVSVADTNRKRRTRKGGFSLAQHEMPGKISLVDHRRYLAMQPPQVLCQGTTSVVPVNPSPTVIPTEDLSPSGGIRGSPRTIRTFRCGRTADPSTTAHKNRAFARDDRQLLRYI